MPESTQPDNDARGEEPRSPQDSRVEDPPAYPDPVSSRSLQRSCDSTLSILAAVHTTDLDLPTPCASWTVRDLVNHILGGTAFFAELAEAGLVADRDEDPDLTAGDFNHTFSQGARRLVAAFSAPGAMDKIMKTQMGELPGSVCAWIAASDIFTHGWDLAKATGQPTDLEPELAEVMLARVMQTLPDSMRGPEGEAPFGPRVEAAESAPAADRLAAFLGRQP